MTLPLIPWATPDEIVQGIEDLQAAARQLEDHGWTQHSYSEGRACCAAGAINRVTNEGEGMTNFLKSLKYNSRSAVACGIFYRIAGVDIVTFNDAEHRTAKEVISRIRDVARTARLWLPKELPPVITVDLSQGSTS